MERRFVAIVSIAIVAVVVSIAWFVISLIELSSAVAVVAMTLRVIVIAFVVHSIIIKALLIGSKAAVSVLILCVLLFLERVRQLALMSSSAWRTLVSIDFDFL